MMTSADTTTSVTACDEWADTMFSAPGGRLMRLIAPNRNELYVHRRPDGWHDATAGLAAPFGAPSTPDTPETFCLRHGVDVQFALRLHKALGPGALCEPTALWTRIVPPRLPVRGAVESEGRVDPAAHAAACLRLTTFTPPPSVVIDAELELVALWLLTEPIDEMSALPLRVALARDLDGDIRFAHAPCPDPTIPRPRWRGP